MYPFNTLLRSLEVLRRDTKPQGLIFLLYLFGVDYVVTLSTCSCKKVQETGRRSCGEGNDAQMCARGWRRGCSFRLYVATPAKGED